MLGLTRGDSSRFQTSQSASAFLRELAYHAARVCPNKAPAVFAKAEELALEQGDALDLHFAYSEAIKFWYGRRDTDPEALPAAISACERQIALAPSAAKAFREHAVEPVQGLSRFEGRRVEPVFTPVSHRGFQQLAIIREKQGDLEGALRLAREAQALGWRDGKKDWSDRMARLEKRLAKRTPSK
jgi:tetratricopeptide (TPR) repeat protein